MTRRHAKILGIVAAILIPSAACSSDAAPSSQVATEEHASVAWSPWSDASFAKAAAEGKLVCLHLGAGWCHWCHVMEKETYGRKDVADYLDRHFVAIHVDQDADPALSRKYERWGWPATMIFDAQGRELVKRRGYIPADEFLSLLAAVVKDPTPGPSVVAADPIVAGRGAVDADLRSELNRLHVEHFDEKMIGWGGGMQKYVDAPSIEWSLLCGQDGDATALERARATLDKARALIDPVWGGVYQYSDDGGWTSPHFEKIMQVQTESLRLYALAAAVWKTKEFADAAAAIAGYLENFLLSPTGAFYTSQDADLRPGEHAGDYFKLSDAERRKLGVPRVDRSIYARENGWAIGAFAFYGNLSGNERFVRLAERAAREMIEMRGRPDGGFRHGENDGAVIHLGDTLAMAGAFLDLFEATGDPSWFDRTRTALEFLKTTFDRPEGTRTAVGYPSGWTPGTTLEAFRLEPQTEENLALVRLVARVTYLDPKDFHSDMIARAMSFLTSAAVARRRPNAIPLLAERAVQGPSLIVVVGRPDDPKTRELCETARRFPQQDRIVVLKNPDDSNPLSGVADYVAQDGPTAYLCRGKSCSPPTNDAESLAALFAP